MITTRRSENNTISSFDRESSGVSVALLERNETANVAYSASASEDIEQARARMQDNLAKLMNYDRYSEQVTDSAIAEVETATQEQIQESVRAFSEDDIRPTSTTMQFGDGDIEKMRMDMQKQEEKEQVGSYRLNGKGKLVIVLYALVLTVVLALIAINSGVLATLNTNYQTVALEYQNVVQEYSALKSEIDYTETDEYINEQAIKLGLIKQ